MVTLFSLVLLGSLSTISADGSISHSSDVPVANAPEAKEYYGESPWDDDGDAHHDANSHSRSMEQAPNSDDRGVCSRVYPEFCLRFGKIQDYLSPHVMAPANLVKLRDQLRNGKVGVIRNAFEPQFAEAMYQELNVLDYSFQERYDNDGFAVVHHNVYEKEKYSDFMLTVDRIFDSHQTRSFMSDLSGRDCFGDLRSGASWFAPGDYALPHNDQGESRALTFVWHLSKNWRPEWGGALYWCPENHKENAYIHASFNTLILFAVNHETTHQVTQVSRHAPEKRLSWNSWWHSGWIPSPSDNLEAYLDTPDKRKHLTRNQMQELIHILDSRHLPEDLHERIYTLVTMAQAYTNPPRSVVHVVESTAGPHVAH
jgi:2OG-Fe(II) oxygenase superfamily